MNATKIIKRVSELKSERSKHEATWAELYKYGCPERSQTFHDVSQDGLEQTRKIDRANLFDTTAAEAIQLFVSSIISATTPASSKWFKAVPSGIDVPEQMTEGERWLENVTDFIFRNIHASNFDSEVADYLSDLVVAGWAVMYADVNTTGGYVFNTWNIGSCYISSTKANGIIDTIYREYELTAEQAVNEFGIDSVSDKIKKSYDNKPDSKFTFIHAIYPRDPSLVKGDEGKRIDKSMPYASLHIEVQSKHVLKESGYEEFPCIVSRFKKLPESFYGIGQMALALSDAKTCNEIVKLTLQSAELSLGGLWIAQDDGVINPHTLRIRPRAVITANSVDSIKRLDTGQQVSLGLDLLSHFQAKIKRVLMSDQLTPIGSSPLTATEVTARVNTYRQQLGAVFGRLQAEYLHQLLERLWGLAMRSGVLPPAPEELMVASKISFKFINPLAAAQKLESVTAIQNMMLSITELAQIDPTIMDNIKIDSIAQIVGDGLGVPMIILRTEEELAEVRQQRQEQEQAIQKQQAMQQMTQTGMEIARDQAKNMTPEQIGEMLE